MSNQLKICLGIWVLIGITKFTRIEQTDAELFMSHVTVWRIFKKASIVYFIKISKNELGTKILHIRQKGFYLIVS